MRTFASVLFLLLCSAAAAQRACVTQDYNQSTSSSASAALERFIQQQSRALTSGTSSHGSSSKMAAIIRIPVVVHVLYNTAAQNVSDAEIKSGIAALNRDFRRTNGDTIRTPERFKALAADVQIEFELATADPNGVATTGIVRKQTAVSAWTMNDKIKRSADGGDDAWDSKKYLNIWLGNTRTLLGYATMPGGDEKLDGLVISFRAFGTISAAAPYNLGRTAVHETGHWLGLHHVWGDAFCGDDYVGDTPKQGGFTTGCPSTVRTSCGNGSAGDMYMNYMDFTNDACMNLFTHGQKERMRALFASGGPRHSLLTSTGLQAPWAEAKPAPAKDMVMQPAFLQVYPNPASQHVVVQFATSETTTAGTLYLINASGTIVQKIVVTAARYSLNIAHLPAGLYFLQGTINNTPIRHKLVKR